VSLTSGAALTERKLDDDADGLWIGGGKDGRIITATRINGNRRRKRVRVEDFAILLVLGGVLGEG